jgi:8-oxo-dGTP pyrophosphatase MutT (NUDIX family)/NAD(P)H-hydrate repair Nnr-like enzyme with NAD(P)H-hydrate epimerase domain
VTSNAERWHRLREYLRKHGASDDPEHGGRVGAVLALAAERDGDLAFLLTKRRDDLPTHPGQVSFPGGRREPGETTVEAALREASEEVGLRPDSVEVLGPLPAFYVPPSRYWLAPVVGRWIAEHQLRAQETEVAALVWAPLRLLLDVDRWRKVRLSVTGWALAWQLDEGHVLWGATALVMAVLLDALEPGWRNGLQPHELADEREITPWLDPRLGSRIVPARLADVSSRPRVEAPLPPTDPPSPARVEAAGAAIAAAVARLHDRPHRIVVLAGGGGNGAAGAAAASHLARTGAEVDVITATRDGARVAGAVPFVGRLPAADLYIDALVGGGLRGRLRDGPLDVLLALRSHDAQILAVDLPSGLHPVGGLIGDTLAATVTLALGGLWPMLREAGLSPFVGDLYLWDHDTDQIVRLVGGPERTAPSGGWRE